MTTSEILVQAWAQVRDEAQSQPGMYSLRVFANSGHSLFVGVRHPGNLLQLYFDFHLPAAKLPEVKLRGITLTKETLSEKQLRVALAITSASYEDVFLALATDVVTQVVRQATQAEAFDQLVRRIAHWQRFLQAVNAEGLSPERQIGLFGELTLLKILLQATGPATSVLTAWHGPAAANHDFFLGGRAVEVKTTTGNDFNSIPISNEHQLDDNGLTALFLFHLCLEARNGGGTTLPVLVEEVRYRLPPELDPAFTDLLLMAGYIDSQSNLYTTRGYIEKRRTCYRVGNGFPRILQSDLALGVSEVKYRINTSGSAECRLSESDFLKEFCTTVK